MKLVSKMPVSHKNKSNQSKAINQKLKLESSTTKAQSKPSTEKQSKQELIKSQKNSTENHSSSISKIDTVGPNRFQVLNYEQVKRLQRFIETSLQLKPVSHSFLPPINVSLRILLGEIKKQLKDVNILVKDIRLDGVAASSILKLNSTENCRHVDIIFNVDITNIATVQKIKKVVYSFLINTLKNEMSTKPECLKQNIAINEELIKENYIQRMSRVINNQESGGDFWSLISIGIQEAGSESVELRFIEKMKRQYEFTVDSFQIVLDTILAFFTVSKCNAITPNLFPTVVAESVSGSFQEAFKHLKDNIISTKNPEEIHGGGLIKYCHLLAIGYQQNTAMDIRVTEKYMCSRFFIDYPDISNQKYKLESYLEAHFDNTDDVKVNLLNILYEVISHSTVCLMTHERRQTLQMITDLIENLLSEIEIKKSTVQLDNISNQNWFLDQVFYGTLYFPQQVYVTSPINASQTNNLNISGNQILICTGDNTDFIANSNQIVSINQTATVSTIENNNSWMGYQSQNNQIYCLNGSLMCA